MAPVLDTPPTVIDPDQLRRVEAALISIVRGVMAGHHQFDSGMDKAGYVLLNALHRVGEVRQTDLAARIGLDLSTVSRQIKALEELGFVTRSSDPDDKRASVLAVTAAGRREIARPRRVRWAPVAARLAEIDADDRERFVNLLEQLADLSVASPTKTASTTGKAHR